MADAVRDLLLDSSGDLVVTDGDLQLVGGADSIRQDAEVRLRFVRGEWFLATVAGVPYFDEILVKSPNLARVRALLVAELLATPGVSAVTDLSLALDGAARRLTGTFAAASDLGAISGAIGAAQ